MKFSILIPVYNSKQYLKSCIDSVLSQKYSDYEVILFDDASTDGSGQICDYYSDNNPTIIKTVHGDPNMGSMKGRIELAKHAGGEYLFFVDADDLLSDNALETISGLIGEYSPDLLIFNMFARYPFRMGYNYDKKCGFLDKTMVIEPDTKNEFYGYLTSFRLNAIWRKVFKRDIWNRIVFEDDYKDLAIGEDLYFTLKYVEQCNRIVYVPEYLYYYRINLSSITHIYRKNEIFDSFKVCGYFLKSLRDSGYIDNDKEYAIYNHLALNIIGHIESMASTTCRLSDAETETQFDSIAKEDLFRSLIDDWPNAIPVEYSFILDGLAEKNYANIKKHIGRKRPAYCFKECLGHLLLK